MCITSISVPLIADSIPFRTRCLALQAQMPCAFGGQWPGKFLPINSNMLCLKEGCGFFNAAFYVLLVLEPALLPMQVGNLMHTVCVAPLIKLVLVLIYITMNQRFWLNLHASWSKSNVRNKSLSHVERPYSPQGCGSHFIEYSIFLGFACVEPILKFTPISLLAKT